MRLSVTGTDAVSVTISEKYKNRYIVRIDGVYSSTISNGKSTKKVRARVNKRGAKDGGRENG
jgi:hypothetical protein